MRLGLGLLVTHAHAEATKWLRLLLTCGPASFHQLNAKCD